MELSEGIFAGIDMELLSGIWMRVVNVETVNEAQAFVQKVREAADILIEAALRIAGREEEDTDTRAILNNEQERAVERICRVYEETDKE